MRVTSHCQDIRNHTWLRKPFLRAERQDHGRSKGKHKAAGYLLIEVFGDVWQCNIVAVKVAVQSVVDIAGGAYISFNTRPVCFFTDVT